MFHKLLSYKVVYWLLLMGLVVIPATSAFAQSEPPNNEPTTVADVETVSNHLFLPLVQGGSAQSAAEGDAPDVTMDTAITESLSQTEELDELSMVTGKVNEADALAVADVDTFSHHLYLPLVQGSADATVNAAGGIILPDFCKSQVANATLTLGPAVSGVVSKGNGIKNSGLCKRWIVDIKVPSNSSGTGHDLRSFFIWANSYSGPTTKAACLAYTEYTSIYRKSFGQTAFTWIAGGKSTGTWVDNGGGDFLPFGPCQIQTVSGYVSLPQPLNPPLFGTTVYRVTSTISVSGVSKTVIVNAQHESPPPS